MAWFRKKKNGNDKPTKKPAQKSSQNGKRSYAFRSRLHTQDSTQEAKTSTPPKVIINPPQHEARQVEFSGSSHAANASQPAHQFFTQPSRELPNNYGDNAIYLMVRDPYWLYTYWEIQEPHQHKALEQLGGSWNNVKSVLRVYDVSDSGKPSFYDIALSGMANTWYLDVHPNHSFYVEIGLLHNDGRFIVLARSNTVTTPRAGMSDVIDEQWMGIDFDKMYALSGGFQVGRSSMELQKMMEERLRGAISSGSGVGVISSMSSPVKISKRGFWFVLDCELIVYGATEPDAKVIFQGKEIKLRPDGTFSLRFALPDGKYVLDAHAFSADGVEERVIIPTVTRTTERPAPIFLKSDNHK